jgi:hypothetical protein
MDARRTLFAMSRDGTLVYLPGPNAYRTRLVWLDYPTGRIDTLPFPAAVYASHTLSPDGRRILVHVMEQANDEFRVLDLERGTSMHLPTNPAEGPQGGVPWWRDQATAGPIKPESLVAGPAPDVRQSLVGRVDRGPIVRIGTLSPDGRHVAILVISRGVQPAFG